jgi:hypothetical protein
MKLLFFASIALFSSLFAPISQGATILWAALDENGLSLANGSNLGVGNLVRVGTFDITDGVIAANAGNIAFLNSHFIEFGNARIGDGALGFPEHFSKQSVADSGPSGLNIVGAQIYMWAFASTDNSTVANSISTAFQLGIFYMEKAIDADWAVPVQDPLPGSTTIELTDLSNVNVLATGAHVVVGSFPDGTSDATGAPNFGLAVPEPSAAMAMVASVGLLALRRRRRA